ncbi:hypothetical protein GMES_3917 [Paraglaciecola mesophila KMM 241]|uniref:Uncharacterized protein n=1 Tax=Paraglaciecola mesophila KMM 241 TaxID=1128912 RepID=K6ZSA6_9ALTE|nr:hypothetical protein GMES_3917 [Paraglaciecola mesophila KMM 241]
MWHIFFGVAIGVLTLKQLLKTKILRTNSAILNLTWCKK